MGGKIQHPEKALLRRGEVLRWLGVSRNEFGKLVDAGVIKPRKLRPNGRAFYLRDELIKLVEPEAA